MLHKGLDSQIHNANLRSQQSLAEHKAAKQFQEIPWIRTDQALPQNDFGLKPQHRRQFLVRLMPSKRLIVAQFGYKEHDWWVTPSGRLLTPYYGYTVVGWCPLPTKLGEDTCETDDIPTKPR